MGNLLITKLEPIWSGKELSETVKIGDNLFKIITGLVYGGGHDCTYILGSNGWAPFLTTKDVSDPQKAFKFYVCDSSSVMEREDYAKELNRLFRIALNNIYN